MNLRAFLAVASSQWTFCWLDSHLEEDRVGEGHRVREGYRVGEGHRGRDTRVEILVLE